MLQVVGTLYIENRKLLLTKPRKHKAYQLVAGKIEQGESPLESAIRESREELGTDKLDTSQFEFIMDFEELTSSEPHVPMQYYLFRYNSKLIDEPRTSDEIEGFVWYDTSLTDIPLSFTLQDVVIPYCVDNNLID